MPTSFLTIHCRDVHKLCDPSQNFGVSVTGSHDVSLRFDASTDDDTDVVAHVSGTSQHAVAELVAVGDLPVLQLSATTGHLDVVILRRQRLERVVNHGSGKLTVSEDVLVTTGPTLTVASDGDVSVVSTAPVSVGKLSLESQGSGRLEASFSQLRVTSMVVEIMSSGSATLSSGSKVAVDDLVLTVEGSGTLCVSGTSIDATKLTVDKMGSGDVSLGPRGTCGTAKMSTSGAGVLDAGGIRCSNINVDLVGSGTVIIQATEKLSGDVYGSGRLEYNGEAPRSIDSVNYLGVVSVTPVSSSYHPSGCKMHTKSVGSDGSESSSLDGSNSTAVEPPDFITLAIIVFLVALLLRWWNESRRRAREEQRQPLLARRVHV